MTVLIVAEPQSHIFIIVHEIERTVAVLLVLKPLTLIFLAVREGIDSLPLTLAFHIVAFVGVAVLELRNTLSVGSSRLHFAFILSSVMRGT